MGLRLKNEIVAHKLGIGRKLDASDIEPMLCMFYIIHQKKGPSRNVTMKEMYMDGQNDHPVLNDDCPTRDLLPFMRPIVDIQYDFIFQGGIYFPYQHMKEQKYYCSSSF